MSTLFLSGGMVAALLFVLVFTVDGLTRPGYRPRRHPISALALGPRGWIQAANFLVTGLLMLGGAVGTRLALADAGVGWLFGWLLPLLFGALAVGMVLSGVFPMDAMRGYPPGTPDGDPDQLSGTHRMHDRVGSVVFLAMPALCFVGVAMLVVRPGGLSWAVGGALAGVTLLFLLGRFGREWESDGDSLGLVQRGMVLVGFGWIEALLAWLMLSG